MYATSNGEKDRPNKLLDSLINIYLFTKVNSKPIIMLKDFLSKAK